MMQVTLNIPNQNAWQALQPLMQFLHIEVIDAPNHADLLINKSNKSKLELMQAAVNDPLFNADITEINSDFTHIDKENF